MEKANLVERIKTHLHVLCNEIGERRVGSEKNRMATDCPKEVSILEPEEHQHLISVLEKNRPLALITATERNSALAGGVYPFPMFEDGDFDIPSVFLIQRLTLRGQ